MRANVVRIGNSKGIRLPGTMLKQCGIGSKVELEIEGNRIIIKPVEEPRKSWETAFKRMSQYGDDAQLISDEMDTDLLEEWNAN